MRKFLFLTAVFAILASYSEYSYSETKLIPGTDKAQVKDCSSGTAYIYEDYIIHTEPTGDFDGSNIYIYAPARDSNPCNMNTKTAHYAIGVGEYGGVNKFAGKHENLIFIDQWTGRDFKKLLAINIENKSLVFLDTYAEPEISGGELIYYRTLKSKRKSVRDKIPCPRAGEWVSQGKQVLYVEKITVNLDTMKKQPSGELSCMPADPIGNTKPRTYGH